MSRLVLLGAALLALAAASGSEAASGGDDGAGRRNEAARTVARPGNLELGRRIYNFRCYYCHGYSGNARTLAATMLNPKPVDFTATSLDALSRERMMKSIQSGRPGTAMMSFANVLKPDEIAAVADFVRYEFMSKKAENTRYHTPRNGWYNHERYKAAYPFALGQIALDTPWDQLTPAQAAGKRLYLASCVSCHDRGHVASSGIRWESRAVSYPRNEFSPGDYPPTPPGERQGLDAMASATPYHLHDLPPKLEGLTDSERRGEQLFQHNCAFCHAADGTGKNWIGSFMEPHPRNLVESEAMKTMTRTRLRNVIREGLPGTSMSAWKSVLSEQDVQDIVAYVARAFHPLPP
jgi:cytochrome c oxidase cbb3-type subunit 3